MEKGVELIVDMSVIYVAGSESRSSGSDSDADSVQSPFVGSKGAHGS